MYKRLRTLALIVAALMVVYMIGCGDDDDDSTVEEVAATLSSTNPANGGTIAANGVLTMTFSGPPETVTVNGGSAVVAGSTATWTATGLTPGGTANLAIAWTIAGGGSSTVTLTIEAEDTTAPTVTGGTVKDGDVDVDPEPLNTDGIEITFSEPLATGSYLDLVDEAGEIIWAGWIDGNVCCCCPWPWPSPRPDPVPLLRNETKYWLVGSVQDAAGNLTPVEMTFVTVGKE